MEKKDRKKAIVTGASIGMGRGITLRVDGGLILPGMPEDPNYPGDWR